MTEKRISEFTLQGVAKQVNSASDAAETVAMLVRLIAIKMPINASTEEIWGFLSEIEQACGAYIQE